MNVSQDFFDQLCPSYKNAIKNLDQQLDEYNGDVEKRREIMLEFSSKYLMPIPYWCDIIREAKPTGDEKLLNILATKAQQHLYAFLLPPKDNDTPLNKLLMFLFSEDYEGFGVRYDEKDLCYPHPHLSGCLYKIETASNRPLPKELLKIYESNKEWYQKIKAAESNVAEWFKLICKFGDESGDDQYVKLMVEYRLGLNLFDIQLWKLYLEYLRVHDIDNVILLLDHKKILKPPPVEEEIVEPTINNGNNNNDGNNNGGNNNDGNNNDGNNNNGNNNDGNNNDGNNNNDNNDEEEEEAEYMAIDEIVLEDEDVVMESGSEDEGDDETSDYYRFQFTQFDQSNPKKWPSLVTYRKEFVKALIESLQQYYDNDDLNDFEVLNVNDLQVTNGDIIFPADNQDQHENLAKRFKINSPNIGLQYQNLLKNVLNTVTDTEFKKWMLLPPQIFYAKVLETAESDDMIDLSDELFDYISSALTVPVGSADAERGFSILFHSLDSRRSRLNISTIDSILNIRLNGPPLNKFVCYKYVEDWKNEKHLLSDAQRPRGPGKKRMNNIILSDDPIENFVKDEEAQSRWDKRFELFIPDPFN